MIPLQLIEKLHDFEDRFPDKSSINLSEAKKYLTSVVGKEIPDDLIKQYLAAKGYYQIVEVSDSLDELDLDEIVNLDWSQKRNILQPEKAEGSHFKNTYWLNEYYSGDREASFERLIIDNMRLVHKIASRYQNYIAHQLAYDDLVSEGTIGLIQAIQKFDISMDVQFSTYAVWWIRQRILRAIFDTGTIVRIPVHMIETVLKVKRAELAYSLKGETPNVKSICSELGLSESVYAKSKQVEHRYLSISSLNQFVSEENQDSELIDFVSVESHEVIGVYHPEYLDPSILFDQKEVRDRLLLTLSKHLKQREREVIFERFGLLDNTPKTLELVGKQFGVTRERIRQIEAKALRKLRAKMTNTTVREDFRWPEFRTGG
ncbi:sigma-70 family RNA polymerase sigma factor [Cohnella candidum]|nr:sigma-70 family RNA polymerase sigma factor [Cohnella candidum]